jgi:hypothetical protein
MDSTKFALWSYIVVTPSSTQPIRTRFLCELQKIEHSIADSHTSMDTMIELAKGATTLARRFAVIAAVEANHAKQLQSKLASSSDIS